MGIMAREGLFVYDLSELKILTPVSPARRGTFTQISVFLRLLVFFDFESGANAGQTYGRACKTCKAAYWDDRIK